MPRLPRLAVLLVAVAALGLVPGAAAAATVTVSQQVARGTDGLGVVLQGGPADEQITATPDASGVLLDDDQETLTVGGVPGCAPVDDHHVRCGAVEFLDLRGGSGNDTITVAGPVPISTLTLLNGEDGDDHLTGGDGGETLNGGPGADVLDGGGGRDFLDGGPGADSVTGGPGDDVVTETAGDGGSLDRLDGGDGVDQLLVASDPAAAATLDVEGATISGAASASFTGFESYGATLRPELTTLVGSGGPDLLGGGGTMYGRGGDDVLANTRGGGAIFGGDGDDTLTGGTGTTLDGGPGDDVLSLDDTSARDGRSLGRIACGDGDDLVRWPGTVLVPLDCERVELVGTVGSFTHPSVARGALALRITRANKAYTYCGALVVARRAGAGGATLTSTMRVRRSTYGRGTLHLPLTSRGRARRLRDVLVTVTGVSRCSGRGAWAPVARSRAAVRLAVATS